MPRIKDNSSPRTEDELIYASKHNTWTVGDVLSNYTGEIKLARILEELSDNGDLHRWAIDCGISDKEMQSVIIEAYDDLANLRIYRMLPGLSVRCTITLLNKYTLYMQLGVASDEYNEALERRVNRLERLIFK